MPPSARKAIELGLVFWLRWAGRDLRGRLAQVVAIATIIAVGAGVYAGLGSTSVWRQRSLDASLSGLAAHDVRVSVVGGTTTEPEPLLRAITEAGGPTIADVEARLVVGAPVTATHRGATIPAAGQIIGVDLTTGPRIDRWRVMAGRDLRAGDDGDPVALLDLHFARQHRLPDSGRIRIGTTEVRYVGLALSPDDLNVNTTSGEAIQGPATRAVLFTSLALAQDLGGAPGRVNDATVALAPGSDAAQTVDVLAGALATRLPDVAVLVTARSDDPSLRTLYDEIDSEQQIFDVFALLVLAGAGFAAFNLTTRVVAAQRREIGIAMSLGVPPARIAIRTMLLAAEITAIGVLLGVAVGWGIGAWVLAVIRDRSPLPHWETPFQPGLFTRAALLGLTIPLLGSAIAVARAVRIPPIEALVPAHLRTGGHRLTGLLRHLRLPGTTTIQAPLRRIVRAPVRSVLTVIAIAVIIAPLLAALGATDSASAAIDAGEEAVGGTDGDRLLVDLDSFVPETAEVVDTIAGSPLVAQAEPGLNIGGYLTDGTDGETEIGVSLSLGDLDSSVSVPPSIASLDLDPGGIVISRPAADDLHVGPGDEITLRHPRREGTGFRFVSSRLPVRAIHDSPYRFVAYMDRRDAGLMGLEGLVNTIKISPDPGASMTRLQQQIAAIPGVASALPARSLSRTMRDVLSAVDGLFVILQLAIGLLAFLVAFNASNISTDERAREHATMLAFGVRVRQITAIAIAEGLLLGVAGVGLGLGFGAAVLRWILATVFPAAIPDLAVADHIDPSSYLITISIGLAATATAPLLNLRRLRTMDIPSTLRYVE